MSIPASSIVSVTPGVLGAGGTGLALSGVVVTTNARIPVGVALPFPTRGSVASYFGATSIEAQLAAVYFLGFDNSNQKPATLWFVQYPSAAVSAYTRGAALTGMTLAQLQAVTGPITTVIDGVLATGTVNLSAVTSFSAAAQSLSTLLGAAVSYDSVSNAFVITSGSAGAASDVAYATGAGADALGLSQATGALLSQGADAANPLTFMDSVVGLTADWASFMTTFEPDLPGKIAFATWTNNQDNNYAYVCWDSDITATLTGTTGHAGYALGPNGLNVSGTYLCYLDPLKAAFAMGIAASLDYSERNGRTTWAFRQQSGLAADVTDPVSAANLIANGYNFYGAYATAAQGFVLLYPGSILGEFLWADSYYNEIYLTNAFQLALITLLISNKSVPYNDAGYALIEAACLDVINKALNFGAIRAGITLSTAQALTVNQSAGLPIDGILSTRGWYLQVLDPGAQVRSLRQTPQCTFWYTDGGSVQQINLATIEIQ